MGGWVGGAVLTGRSLSHLDGGDATGPQVTLPGRRGKLFTSTRHDDDDDEAEGGGECGGLTL